MIADAPGGVQGAVRRRLSGNIHAGEQAHAEGAVGHNPEALVALRRPHLALQFPVEEVVGILDAEHGIEPEAVLRPQRLEHLPSLEVGDAHVARLASAHHVVQGAQRLLKGSLVVVHVQDVDVDVIRLKAGQGAVDLPHDVIARQTGVVGPVADAAGHLRGDHEVVAVPLEDARQNLLRRAASLVHVPEAVDVGAVDEVDPQLDGPLDGSSARASSASSWPRRPN